MALDEDGGVRLENSRLLVFDGPDRLPPRLDLAHGAAPPMQALQLGRRGLLVLSLPSPHAPLSALAAYLRLRGRGGGGHGDRRDGWEILHTNIGEALDNLKLTHNDWVSQRTNSESASTILTCILTTRIGTKPGGPARQATSNG